MSKIYCFAYWFFVTKIYTWWKYSGPSGLGSFFVIDVTDEAVTSKKYILRYTRKVVFSRVLGFLRIVFS